MDLLDSVIEVVQHLIHYGPARNDAERVALMGKLERDQGQPAENKPDDRPGGYFPAAGQRGEQA